METQTRLKELNLNDKILLIDILCGVLKQSSSPFIIADEVRWVGNWGANK